MLDILVEENYFDDPDLIRKIGLSKKDYRIDNSIGDYGWRGYRTLPLRGFDEICPCCNQKKQFYSPEDEISLRQTRDIFNLCDNHYKLTERFTEDLTITSYFHITTEETRKAFADFWEDKLHRDDLCIVAGVVYLTPDAPPNTGTVILDAKNNKFITVDNIYNRLVAYESDKLHALADVFGDSKETGRMTYTFFIHRLRDSLYMN